MSTPPNGCTRKQVLGVHENPPLEWRRVKDANGSRSFGNTPRLGVHESRCLVLMKPSVGSGDESKDSNATWNQAEVSLPGACSPSPDEDIEQLFLPCSSS